MSVDIHQIYVLSALNTMNVTTIIDTMCGDIEKRCGRGGKHPTFDVACLTKYMLSNKHMNDILKDNESHDSFLSNKDNSAFPAPPSQHIPPQLPEDMDDAESPLVTEATQPLSLFFPREPDNLFWCYYIMRNGQSGYEMLHNRSIVTEKDIKIEYIGKIRENKSTLKAHKITQLPAIESSLLNDRCIDVKTFLALCYLEGVSCIYISRQCYYEINVDADEVSNIHKIQKRVDEQTGRTTYGCAMCDNVHEIREKYVKIDNLSKPLRGVSSYKIDELRHLCEKLHIPMKEKMKKADMYESLVQFFSLF